MIKKITENDIHEYISCDFQKCKCNIDGICKAESPVQCPKNNEQSVYEKEDLVEE